MQYILNMNFAFLINFVCMGSFMLSIPVWYFWCDVTKRWRK